MAQSIPDPEEYELVLSPSFVVCFWREEGKDKQETKLLKFFHVEMLGLKAFFSHVAVSLLSLGLLCYGLSVNLSVPCCVLSAELWSSHSCFTCSP